MEKIQRIKPIQLDGTIEQYNEVIAPLFPKEYFQINFVDEDFNWTNKFTGNFSVFYTLCYPKTDEDNKYLARANRYRGLVFRKGDHFHYDIDENGNAI